MSIERELSFGKVNSLGNTVAVVERVLAEPSLLSELFGCYDSVDEWVRLRTSNAFKRIFRAEPAYFDDYADKFIDLMARLEQPSAQWTFCDLFRENASRLSPTQLQQAKAIMVQLLYESEDWIVLNSAIKAFSVWAITDSELRASILPRLEELTNDQRKSVARTADKAWAKLHDI